MTLRLTEKQDAALAELAEAQGISKTEAVVRAIEESVRRLDGDHEIRRLVRQVVAEDGPLLDRLAQ